MTDFKRLQKLWEQLAQLWLQNTLNPSKKKQPPSESN